MNYTILHDEIILDFDNIPSTQVRDSLKSHHFRWDPERRVWHGANTPENEALAKSLAGEVSPELTLDEQLQMCIDSPTSDAKNTLADSLENDVNDRFDEYLDFIHKTVEEESSIQDKIKECENRIKEEKSGYEAQKKALIAKRQIVEQVVATYLHSIGEERTRGGQYNVAIKETYKYLLEEEFKESLKEKLSGLLPDWIDIDFKVKSDAMPMDPMPESIIVKKDKQAISVWSDNEIAPGLSRQRMADLIAFNEGKDIQTIAAERGVRWRSVFDNLKDCINSGHLDIVSIVGQDTIERIKQLKSENPDMSRNDIVTALDNAVSYDYVALILSTLCL